MARKLTVIIAVLVLFEVLIAYTGRNSYLNAVEHGNLNSFSELFTKRQAYLFLIPMMLGPLGLIIRQKVGWIFTASFFYVISITNLIAIAIHGRINSSKEASAFLALTVVTATPVIYLNMADIKSFFRLEPTDKLIRENLTSLGLAALTGGLFFALNFVINYM